MTRNWWPPLAKRQTRSSNQAHDRFRPRYRRQFRPCVERLEERYLLSVDFSQVQQQLPGVLNNLQQAVTQNLLPTLPLVGDSLKNAPAAKLIDALKNQLQPNLHQT